MSREAPDGQFGDIGHLGFRGLGYLGFTVQGLGWRVLRV